MQSEKQPADKRRPIRSFVLRQGRLTEGQARAIEQLWPVYGLEPEGEVLDLPKVFGRTAPLVIEIGFGNGDATWRMAQAEPEKNFIGIEVHQPGVGQLLQALELHGLNNTRIACTDAVEFVQNRLSPDSVSEFRIYFPDPWPKKRHNKRRIIQPAFLDLLARRLAPHGLIHLATDWAPYAEHMLEVLDADSRFTNTVVEGGYCKQPDWRPHTKYEARGERLGHKVFDLLFTLGNQTRANV